MTGAPFPHRPSLRLIAPMPPARPRLREVRLTALAGRYPYGGVTQTFHLTDRDLADRDRHADGAAARLPYFLSFTKPHRFAKNGCPGANQDSRSPGRFWPRKV
jgi:hypothetical protein